MPGTIDARLKLLGIELPQAPKPAANYVPFVIVGPLVFCAGQVPVWNGEVRYKGRLGEGLGVDDGYQAARLCGLNLIAQVKAAAGGDLDRVKRVVKLGGFVSSAASFAD
ncbi:MAG: RidA family protein, partial [Rhodospirillales bacterium]|nr:RidA family protein [Rhodospirillales bacterium]